MTPQEAARRANLRAACFRTLWWLELTEYQIHDSRS